MLNSLKTTYGGQRNKNAKNYSQNHLNQRVGDRNACNQHQLHVLLQATLFQTAMNIRYDD